MDYSKSIPIRDNGDKVLELARWTFIQQGFVVSPITRQRFDAQGGRLLQKNRDPLHGVSRAVVFLSSGRLTIEADLGGIAKVRNFLLVFLPSLALGLMAVFAVVGHFAGWPPMLTFVLPLAPLAPWIVLLPILLAILRKQTIRALETLLRNLETVGKE